MDQKSTAPKKSNINHNLQSIRTNDVEKHEAAGENIIRYREAQTSNSKRMSCFKKRSPPKLSRASKTLKLTDDKRSKGECYERAWNTNKYAECKNSNRWNHEVIISEVETHFSKYSAWLITLLWHGAHLVALLWKLLATTLKTCIYCTMKHYLGVAIV